MLRTIAAIRGLALPLQMTVSRPLEASPGPSTSIPRELVKQLENLGSTKATVGDKLITWHFLVDMYC